MKLHMSDQKNQEAVVYKTDNLLINDNVHEITIEDNKLRREDVAAHDWYRFVLSYPPHLVRDYLHHFEMNHRKLVLDPFCGTGTTLVECKKMGIPSVGIEANQMAHMACAVKTDWVP